MRVNGSDFKDVGNHTFRVTITDTHNSTFEFFKIEIYNTPPVFILTDEVPTGKIELRLNHKYEFYYPPVYDE